MTIHERDMGRAGWQRSVGASVMIEWASLFDNVPTFIPEELQDILYSADDICARLPDTESRQAWATAYAVAAAAFSIDRLGAPSDEDCPSEFVSALEIYTHYGSSTQVWLEALQTSSRIPLNLAFRLVADSQAVGHPVAQIDSLSDICDLIDHPSFREIIDEAAFAPNGFWGTWATALATEPDITDARFPKWLSTDNLFISAQAQDSRFSDRVLQLKRGRLSETNTLANPPGMGVTTMSSSGCPARNNRAHFTDRPEDQAALAAIAAHYGRKSEYYTEERETSPVQVSMDYLTRTLRGLENTLADYRIAPPASG